ncbi:DUF4143 domain-containing protein [Candidatus Palauibacter sp.]|uniref:DUF4143 domain-containing protein n=1 Tax=Candidatus Palauibacter sp. TaxID=3101350 RepID=UPI003C6EF265
MFFWHTAAGVEVDFLVEAGTKLIPIEVKKSTTPRPAMATSLRAFQRDLGDRMGPAYLLHSGDGRLPLGSGVIAVGFAKL